MFIDFLDKHGDIILMPQKYKNKTTFPNYMKLFWDYKRLFKTLFLYLTDYQQYKTFAAIDFWLLEAILWGKIGKLG